MSSIYEATQDALDHFSSVDQPALDALLRQKATDLPGFANARKQAVDRVRAAFLKDTQDFNTPENVELMSIDVIRREVRGTLLARLFSFLP